MPPDIATCPLEGLDHLQMRTAEPRLRRSLVFARMSATRCCLCLCLQYLADCDEVIFMKEGCITERGTHEELMNLNGDYATIFNNLLLGETPPVEVRFAWHACMCGCVHVCMCVCLSSKRAMTILSDGESYYLNSVSVSCWPGPRFLVTRLLCISPHTGSALGE